MRRVVGVWDGRCVYDTAIIYTREEDNCVYIYVYMTTINNSYERALYVWLSRHTGGVCALECEMCRER
jgi:hypothetical protein